MASPVTDHLRESVYPQLDAVKVGLVEHLEPTRKGSAYHLTCPACHHRRRAFYYPGSSMVVCNRRGECGGAMSIWDIVEQRQQLSGGEVYRTLCAAAGVEPINSDSGVGRQERSLQQWVREYFPAQLFRHPEARDYMRRRGYSDEDLSSLELGYYPDTRSVYKALSEARMDLDRAREWGILPNRKQGRRSPMERRIVGIWVQPDQTYRLWGRAIDGEVTPKYLFSGGMTKRRPYRFRHVGRGSLVCVEGPLDADALNLSGIPACATGGAEVQQGQAAFFAESGIPQIIHLVDDDEAGHRGAMRTIRNCERLGIPVRIASLPLGGGDPDDLYRQGRHDVLEEVVSSAHSAGEYLGRLYLAQLDTYTDRAESLLAAIHAVVPQLTPGSGAAFDLTLQRAGAMVSAWRPRVLREAANMLEAGLSMDAVQREIERRYRFRLKMEASE